MPILTVQNLTKTYTVANADTTVLDHVSFTVEEGSFVAIIGASGSGKSTPPASARRRGSAERRQRDCGRRRYFQSLRTGAFPLSATEGLGGVSVL